MDEMQPPEHPGVKAWDEKRIKAGARQGEGAG